MTSMDQLNVEQLDELSRIVRRNAIAGISPLLAEETIHALIGMSKEMLRMKSLQQHSAPAEAAPTTSATHDLKTWPEYFAQLWDGSRRFELRLNDRDYQVGDTLRLREYEPSGRSHSGRSVTVTVTYMLRGPAFGLREPWVIMSTREIGRSESEVGSHG